MLEGFKYHEVEWRACFSSLKTHLCGNDPVCVRLRECGLWLGFREPSRETESDSGSGSEAVLWSCKGNPRPATASSGERDAMRH